MRFAPIAGALLLLPVAHADALSPLARWDLELRRDMRGTWLVMEGPRTDYLQAMQTSEAAFRDLLEELRMPLEHLKEGEALASALRQRYGWGPEGRWALIGPHGEVRATQASAPTPEALTNALREAGIHSRLEVLQAFLRRNPDHLEARVEILHELISRAERQTRRILGIKPSTEPPAPDQAQDKPPVPELDPDKDQEVWGPAAAALDRLLSRDLELVPYGIGGWLSGEGVAHSHAIRGVVARHMPEVEAALARRPSEWQLWALWQQSARILGGRSLKAILDTLVPLPDTPPSRWPPEAVLTSYLKGARAREDWATIRETLESRLLDEEGAIYVISPEEEEPFHKSNWNTRDGLLVEALLNLGDTAAADEWVRKALDRTRWAGLPGAAKALALKMNQPALAARWGALTPSRK